MKNNVVVIGAGPAGIIASATASKNGNNVILIEKNEFIGKKMLITGNGRCNVTNACEIDELIDNVSRNKEFLYSAFYSFSNNDIINILEDYGVKIKTEKDKRCFPKSDKAMDVIEALKKYLLDQEVSLFLNSNVDEVIKTKENFIINYSNKNIKNTLLADKVIIATGGKTYPSTGSTGDGFKFAEKLGHNIIPLIPSIVPINLKEKSIEDVRGISLQNIKLSLKKKNKLVDSEMGDIIFTHFGLSGPAIFNLTCRNNRFIRYNDNLNITIDLFSNLNIKELDEKILSLLNSNPNKNIINILNSIVQNNLLLFIFKILKIDDSLKANNLTKEKRKLIVKTFKDINFQVLGLRSIEEAYVTSGGVDINEVNPSTMESNIVENLFLCGEVLDVDAYTGGFNLQIGYSTGYLAGLSC
ncbi:MAG: NAD(P)/FAD-dependent oxidoreductase [Senegalia sp. (in: firmicutes)]|uniref:NAD(P)/FAD-dependent oxidoreductase n=1 Tax=Senegalia sp. (in: firmicutes) TaxID=1924098 RepID=UPI003F96978D